MSEQEAFEQFLLSDDFKNAGNLYGWKGVAESAWQAATAEANKRINELEGDVAELKEKLKFSEYAAAAESKFSDKLSDQVTELQANNNNLREELSDARHEVFELTISRNYEAAISKAVQLYHKMSTSPATPAESLQAFENEVLERAAKVCDEQGNEWDSDSQITHLNYAEHCAMVIRAFKKK